MCDVDVERDGCGDVVSDVDVVSECVVVRLVIVGVVVLSGDIVDVIEFDGEVECEVE